MYRFLDAGTMTVEVAESTATSYINACTPSGISGYVMLTNSGQDMASQIIDLLTPVAWGFLLIVFCLDLMQRTYQDNFNIQQLIGPFAKLIAGVVAISMCPKLSAGLMEISNGLITEIGGVGLMESHSLANANKAVSTTDDILKSFDNSLALNGASAISGIVGSLKDRNLAINLFGGLLLIVQMFPAWLAAKALSLYLAITMLYRNIEFWLRCAFLPIACADLLHNGMNSHGIKYCGKILAVGAQGALIVAMYAIIADVVKMLDTFGGGFFSPGEHVTIYICTVCVLCFFGLRFIKNIANDVFV